MMIQSQNRENISIATQETEMTITQPHIIGWFQAYKIAVDTHADQLNKLDAVIGDGDYGASIQRGLEAVSKLIPSVSDQDIGAILSKCGMKMMSTMGGTSGPLTGTLFVHMGIWAKGKRYLTLAEGTSAFKAGVDSVMSLGGAQVGDKTMIDAFVPAVETLQAAVKSGLSLSKALSQATQAAKDGYENTANLVAHKGRASYVGERSLGHIDPGAFSAYLLINALTETVV